MKKKRTAQLPHRVASMQRISVSALTRRSFARRAVREGVSFNLWTSIALLVSGAVARSILSGALMAVFFSLSNASPENTTIKNSRMPGKREAETGCWNVIPSPNANEIENELYAVTGDGNDVWAIGIYDLFGLGNYRTLTIHWDGNAWSLIPSPNPGDLHDYLFGATGSGNDAWAVGMYNNHGDQPGGAHTLHPNSWRAMRPEGIPPGGPGMTLTLHWNGSAWSRVTSPNVGRDFNDLSGVTGSGNDV